MKQVGVFGGSFNPPHMAHLVVAETVCDQFGMDYILWVPSYQPPHKTGEALVSAEHRLQMTRRAVEGHPVFRVSDIEVRRRGTSYTIDTLKMLRKAHPDTEFSLIIGSDSLRTFASWHRAEEIAEHTRLIVYKRPGALTSVADPRFANNVHYADAPLLEISGTEIRARCRHARSIRYFVPEGVRRYIEEHSLYREDELEVSTWAEEEEDVIR